MYFKIVMFCICLLIKSGISYSQNPIKKRCVTDEYYQQQVLLYPEILEYEKSIEKYLLALKNDTTSSNRTASLVGVKVIPVVFHLIGDVAIANMNLSRLTDQITILNNDYRKKPGTAGYGNGVDVEVEFCLATKDPDGLYTSGYVEVPGNYGPYPINSNAMKTLSVWPSNKYLNIWIVTESPSYYGYSSPIAAFFTSPQYDGIVVGDDAVGYNPNNYLITGRTLTHEIGHWLGIKHPFMLGSCGDNDNCADTPDAKDQFYSQQSQNCNIPLIGDLYYCPNVTRQIENYMDYSNDYCFNMFTACQKQKMRDNLEAVRASVVDPSNMATCDNTTSGGSGYSGGGYGSAATCCFCKECIPREPFLNINGGLKGGTSGITRELIANNITAGGTSYYTTPQNSVGKVSLIADAYVIKEFVSYSYDYGSITLTPGFYFFTNNNSDNEITFKLCNLKEAAGYSDSKCSKLTAIPNPSDGDRNNRIGHFDTIVGAYIKPPQVSNNRVATDNIITHSNNEFITVFPNPSNNGLFTLQFVNTSTEFSYKVINATGTLVLQGSFINNYKLNMSEQQQGIYQLVIYNQQYSYTKTIIYN